MAERGWLPCPLAARIVVEHIHLMRPLDPLLRRLALGMVRARAQKFILNGTLEEEVSVPSHFWEPSEKFNFDGFATGDFEKRVGSDAAYGVSFREDDIYSLIGISKPFGSKGGRPPKEWWEDLWLFLAAQLYNGSLIPTKASDIERAMLDWADNAGHSLSESTARTKARRFWQAIDADSQN